MNVLHFLHGKMNIVHDALLRLDLNLLLVFDALFRHRSVAAAADELAMSPSACSHALSRLRAALSDELFLRHGSAMQPTAQAEQIAPRIAESLANLSETLSGAAAFTPATSTQTFLFAATDFTAFALLPALVARLATTAPHIGIKVVYSAHRESLDELAAGRVHFALGFSHESGILSEGVEALECFTDDYVVASRKKHARIRSSLSLDQYLAERHVVVLPWTDSGSVIDAALAERGLKRDVAVQLPSVMAAPFVVANSELLITLPRRAAQRLSGAAPIRLFEAPFPSPRYTLRIYFHARHSNASAHRWMREQMLQALNDGSN
jgi:DNA-binding transcriptional LysR family regulator